MNEYMPAYTNGPLKKEWYINPVMEQELVEFKEEIWDLFAKSTLVGYKFPWWYKDNEPE